MGKAFLVAQREVVEATKTKGFWIGILVFPLVLFASIGAPILLERSKSVRTYAVRDSSGWLADAVEREAMVADARRLLVEAASRQATGRNLAAVPAVLRDRAPEASALAPAALDSSARALVANAEWRAWWDTASVQSIRRISTAVSRARYRRVAADGDLNRRVADGELFAYLEIGRDPVTDNAGFAFVSRNLADESLREWYEKQATGLVRKRRIERERISPHTAAWLQQEVTFPERTVSKAGARTDVGMKDKLRQNSPVVFVYILWISIFSITQGLMTSTLEEKTTRISEVLLSSVSPVQLMGGKIAGVAGTGLLMILTWIATAFVAVKFLPRMLGAPATLDLTPVLSDPAFLLGFVIYFILGYLLYAAILIGIGALVNTIQEAQTYMMPVMMLLMIPLVAMVPVSRDPNGMFAKVMSYIPPFTPFVMMNRAAGPPSLMEYVLTTMLLIVSIAGALWAAAKIFRIGILMTGKPPRPREVLQWLRAPVGAIPAKAE